MNTSLLECRADWSEAWSLLSYLNQEGSRPLTPTLVPRQRARHTRERPRVATGLCSEHLEFCKLTLVGWFNSCFLCLRRFLSYHTPRVLLVTLNSHYFYLSDYPKYYWYNRIPKRRQPVHYTNRVPASVRKGRKGVARSRARRAHACFRAWWPWIPACLQSPTSPRGDSRQLTDVNLATVCAAPAPGPCSRLTVTTHNCGGRGVIHSPSQRRAAQLGEVLFRSLTRFSRF